MVPGAGALPARLESEEAALCDLGAALQDCGYRFTTVTPLTQQRVNARPGNDRARNLRDIFGWNRPFQAAIVPPHLWTLMQRAGVVKPANGGWRCTIRMSTLGENAFFHSAYPTQAKDAVFFGPDTCRFDAAITAQLASQHQPVRRAVDIGCGAGVGALRIALENPGAEALAVDINPRAVRLAQVNAALAGCDNLRAVCANLFDKVDGNFDLVVANPPYLLDPERRAYRHGGGCLGEGLSLAIVAGAMRRLAPGGTLLLYTGVAMCDGHDPFLDAIHELPTLNKLAWTYREIDPDVFGEELLAPAYAEVERIAAVVLTMTAR